MERIVERLTGVGMVSRSDGTRLRPIGVLARCVPALHEGGTPGLFRIEGYVRVELHEGLSLAGDELSSALEDGRFLDFILKDS